MAKNKPTKTEKKKKKGIVQRMMFGDDSKPDLTPESMKVSKWTLFKDLFFHRFGTMVLLNLLTVLFAVPAALVIILFYMNSAVAAGMVPYSSNLGIGYPVVTDAVSQGNITAFTYQTMEYLILVPCIAVFALGVAGNMYVIRKLIWGEPTRTIKDFFIGIKKCWLSAIVAGFMMGCTVMFLVFSLGYFDAYEYSVALKAVCVTIAIILLVFMILFTSFFMTQSAAFKMRPMVLLRNSVLFVLGTNVQAILLIGLSLTPVYLMFIPSITILLLIIYVFIGFSFSTLGISVYCHYCYEKFLYDKIEDKPSTLYTKRKHEDDIGDADAEKSAAIKKKQSKQTYKNPKKRKRSIDEGSSITPLTPTFRREDLERLEKEHEEVMRESGDSYDDDLGELPDDDMFTDGAVEPSADKPEEL